MNYATYLSRILNATLILFSLLLLSACDETHPDDLPGGVNNPYPEASVAPESSVAIEAADETLVFPVAVTLSRPAPEAGEVRYRLVANTATEGRDYEVTGSTVSFAEGERQVQIQLQLLNDESRSSARELILELTGATNATLGASVSQTITIEPRGQSEGGSEQEVPVLNLPESLSFIAPPAGSDEFSVVIPFSNSLLEDSGVTIHTVSGSALENEHYGEISGTNCSGSVCNAEQGADELTFFLTLIGDTDAEDRSFRLQFLAADGFDLPGNREVEVTVSYPDSSASATPELLIPEQLSLRMPTAERGQISYPLVFALSETLLEEATIAWRTVDGSAQAGTHFNAVDATGTNTQTLAAGASEFSLELELLHDAEASQNLNFELQLVSSDGVVLPETRTIDIEIVNSNVGAGSTPQLSVPSEVTFHEPLSGSDEKTIRLVLSERLADAGSVGVSFIEESAKAGLHYVDFDGRISAPAGSAEIAIPLTLLARVNEAANTSLRVELYDAQGMDLPDNRSFGVNIEDSGAKAPTPNLVLTPSLIRVPTPQAGAAEQVTLYFDFSMPLPTDGALSVRSRNGSAASGIDFSEVNLTNAFVAAGSELIAIDVELLPVASDEVREFELEFSNASEIQLPENRTVTVQIDPVATPAIPNLSVLENETLIAPEDAAADKRRVIVLPFEGEAPLPGTIRVTTRDGSAVAGTDFNLVDTDPQFAVGDNEIVIAFDLEPVAAAVSFELILLSAENATLPTEAEDRVIPITIEPF